MHMKTKNTLNTFENKIKESFIIYSRVPFILLVTSLLLLISYELLFQTVIVSYNAQKNVENKLDNMEEALYDFIVNLGDIEHSHNFYSSFYKFSIDNNIKGHMVIYDSDYNVEYITKPSLEDSTYNRTHNRLFLDRVQNDTSKLTFSSIRQDSMNTNMNTLMVGKQLVNDKGKITYIIYFIDSNSIIDLLQHESVSHIVITDSNDYIIGSTSKSFVEPLNNFINLNKSIDTSNYYISKRIIPSGALQIHTFVLKKSLFEKYSVMALLLVIVSLIFYLGNKKIAEKVGREASISINKLIHAVNKIKKGNLETSVTIDSNDEFEVLGNEFNLMSQQLNALISRNQQLLELKNNAQIKQLEAQFNPHFLYNSLETIRYLIPYDQGKAQDMILYVTQLLRYSIDGEQAMVKFSNDLYYLKIYLNINKIRLDDRLTYDIDVDSEILDIIMPKLMIQPLIENSIKHGFKNSNTLNIQITGKQDINNYYIGVIDDGSGMNKSTLEHIIGLSQNPNIKHGSYGLHSIIQRLNLIYGKNSYMDIDSDENGTRIHLIIPKEIGK